MKHMVRVERKTVTLYRNWIEVEADTPVAAGEAAKKEARGWADDRWNQFDEIDHGVTVVEVES